MFEQILHPIFWAGVVKIIFVDLLLSGDNALVIALACRDLDPKRRLWGMVLGAGAAVLVRFSITAVIAEIMTIPYLRIIGALALMWVAVKLFTQDDGDDGEREAGRSIWHAVRLVVVADIVMSIDNMVAVAAAAGGNIPLIWFGLVVSIPMLVAGAALITMILKQIPVLISIGACFLGYLAIDVASNDPIIADLIDHGVAMHLAFAAAGAGLVLVLAQTSRWMKEWLEEMPG